MAQSDEATSMLEALLQEGRLAGSWSLDESRSEVRLRSASVWGLAKVKGSFGRATGSGTISASGQASGTITVAAESIDTGNKKRDEHLRSADFFDAANHPGITFAAEDVKPSGQGVLVTGSLTVRGQTRPVSFEAQVTTPDDSEIWLDGELEVDRAAYGLTWNQLGMSSMNNTIAVHAVFTRQ